MDKQPKQIIYPKKPKLDFEKGDVIVRKTVKGDYLYAVCLEANFAKKQLLWALMLESSEIKDIKILLTKKPVVVGWYDGICKKYAKMFKYPDEIQKIFTLHLTLRGFIVHGGNQNSYIFTKNFLYINMNIG